MDLEVGRLAWRTFRLDTGRPESLCRTMGDGNWEGGVCEARCPFQGSRWMGGCPPHEHGGRVPQLWCTCGIYGSLSLAHLGKQYPFHVHNLVAVIAAEGTTIIGTHGLRTQRARVVAYWTGFGTLTRLGRDIRRSFPGATEFPTPLTMALEYGLPIDAECDPGAGGDFWTKGEVYV